MIRFLFNTWHGFLFKQYSSIGFSLMRIGWALLELITFGSQLSTWSFLYSTKGVMGRMDCSSVLCNFGAFIYSPMYVYAIYIALVFSLICVLVGYKTKIFVFIALLIITALHDRNHMILNGGDRVERIVGFYLLFANANWMSISNNLQKKKSKTVHYLNSMWSYRLLLLQLIAIYFFIAVHKTEGSIWFNGVAMAHSLHIDHFLRFPQFIYNYLSPFYTILGITTVLIQLSWGLFLFPGLSDISLKSIKIPLTVKQVILLANAFIHIGIMILMEIDTFSAIMIVSYFGLLRDNDIKDMQKLYMAFSGVSQKLFNRYRFR